MTGWLGKVTAWLDSVRDGCAQMLFPPVCWACNGPTQSAGAPFCAACDGQITLDPSPTCPRCAASVGPFVDLSNGCSHCREERFHFDRALRMGPYDRVVRHLILRMKAGDEGLAEVLAERWADILTPRLATLGAAAVVPVPLHWTRHLWRGFNVSEVLGRALASRLKIPCYPRCLYRRRRTPSQMALSREARRENVRSAFAARPYHALAGKCVILVDDVQTTGATVSEAARALRTLKPAEIVVAVLAHTG